MRRFFLAGLLILGMWSASAAADEEVDLELVVLADASGSIDSAEIQFQRQGYANAITHPAVLAAIARGLRGRIALTYVEWGDETSQEVIAPWTVIDGPAPAKSFAEVLLKTPRRAFGMNAIGSAISAAQNLIEANAFNGFRKVIDFSGDSANNWGGPSISDARAAALRAGMIINGLAILCRDEACSGRPVAYDLEKAFAEQIIGGPGSFVITVDSRKSFAEAVRRKLLLEIVMREGAN